MYQYSYLVEQVEVLLSQFEWNSRDSLTETWLTDRYIFVTPANFPRAVTVRRMANDVTYTMYVALPIHLYVYDHTMIQRTKELRSLVYETAASATEVVTVATNLVLDESHRADPAEDHLSRERLARDSI